MGIRGPIERPGFFIKRLDQGTPITPEQPYLDVPDAVKAANKDNPRFLEEMKRLLDTGVSRVFRVAGKDDTQGFGLDYISVRKGLDFPKHRHDRHTAVFYIISGEGQALVGDETISISAGDCILIRPGTRHAVYSDPGPLDYIAISYPDLRIPDQHGYDFVID